jgi:hypothetical protein
MIEGSGSVPRTNGSGSESRRSGSGSATLVTVVLIVVGHCYKFTALFMQFLPCFVAKFGAMLWTVEPKIFLSAPVPAPDCFIRNLENYLF